jgi:ribose-phosphate pyrophosphokinase
MKTPLLFSGSSHPVLANAICHELKIAPGQICLSKFPDGETRVELQEDVHGRDVFVLQTIAQRPNDYLFELLIIIDALKRGNARSISAILPYFGYCRQDRKTKPGEPVTAKLIANLLSVAGIDHLITFDLHSDQIEGFFEITLDHLHGQELLSSGIKAELAEECDNLLVVAPDIGSVKIAERFSHQLGARLAIIRKERFDPEHVRSSLIGEITDSHVLLADDLCSTANTLLAAAHLCSERGAKSILAAVSHSLLTEESLEKMIKSPINRLFITDTIPIKEPIPELISRLSVAPLIAKGIVRHLEEL